MVGVAKTVDVQARIDVLKGALGIEPERVGVGAFPIANMLPHLSILGEGVCAICDLGTVSSDVIIMANGEPVFGFGELRDNLVEKPLDLVDGMLQGRGHLLGGKRLVSDVHHGLQNRLQLGIFTI